MRPSTVPNDGALVANSLLEASQQLGITQDQLAHAIGVSRATIARIKKRTELGYDESPFAGNGKAFELSLLMLRIYRSLYAIVGGNAAAMKHWMSSPNQHLANETPAELVQTATGITQVLWYLDAMRGKI
ncbi:antitoxin Xre/MbcA/ParS toxin-binding domain-containing protein [Teredinibacter waterburyi]|jgi:Protein of unknown function (DUF2384)./Helix-turn-helix.|uniref:antitoxin Xre/MbcA/ParS toxin-binding domain-containing protein n=1 Tax=Teredinibacter waterburyi TaxID=1500538 RepID=UPI00165FED02|nr:antitoxin Xre/MbcA/ParS toxin-binding domain-containing protein [Teredinibacter waterburyi]